MNKFLLKTRKSYSIVEALLAAAVFSLLATAFTGAYIYGTESTALAGKRDRAHLVAKEGLEAVRNLRDNAWTNLADGSYSLVSSGSTYSLVPISTPDTTDIFSRQIDVSAVDTNRKKITSTVTWQQNLQRTGSITLSTYLSNWGKIIPINKGGMLVYGDGGTTSDAIAYKVFDDNAGTWTAAAAAADVDGATTNKYLRAVRVYSSSTRNEKIMISRHFAGTNQQFIYAQVYNGATGTWGNVSSMSSWTANTFLNAQNFDGAYLANGDFVAVYSDATTTPKYKVWNGSSWGSQLSMRINQAFPVYMTAKVRPGTNELMVVNAGQGKRTETEYYNGAGYSVSNWTNTIHGTNSVGNSFKFNDFDWSPTDTTKGALVYEINSKVTIAKIFSADGSGGGTWSAAVNSPTQANNVQSVLVVGRKTANEFMTCNEDNTAPDNLTCYLINSFTPTFSTPINNILTTGTVTGTQFSMDFDYKLSGSLGITVYSDNTATPQFRTYDPAANTFSTASGLPALTGIMQQNRIMPKSDNDDAIVLMTDANRNLFSILFDSTTNTMYTSPAGKALTNQGTNGSAITDSWYDFVWDIF